MPDRAVDDLIAENERLQERVRELEWDVSTLKTERDAAIGAATLPLAQALRLIRDTTAGFASKHAERTLIEAGFEDPEDDCGIF